MTDTISSEVLEKIDISQFAKLFNYNIPFEKHAEYYFRQMMKSKQYENLPSQIEAFYKFQEGLAEDVSPKKFKFDLSDKIVAHLKSLGVLEKLNKIDLNGHDFSQQKPIYEPGYYYVSIDLNQANWNIYKHFGELDNNLDWPSWLKKEFDAPEAICMSKIFRQIIFGHLNPGRVTKLQERVTKNNLEQVNKASLQHCGIVGISSDEIIIKFKREQLLLNSNPISFIKSDLPVKFKIFTLQGINSFGSTVKVETVYNTSDLEVKYKALREVSGNQFWIHFNNVILERDLLFMNDGRLAKWVI